MKRAPLCVWLLVPAFLSLTSAPALAQAKKPEPAKQPAVAATSSVVSTAVKPMKGTAVTTIKVKNRSYGSIAGLKLDEYWYDKAGNIVTGDSKRVMKPIMPNEIVTIELRTPKDPKMNRNTFQFSHANGKVQVDTVPKFE
jgi:hypothetical protein